MAADHKKKLHIIQWEHLNLWKFYPASLASSWSIRFVIYPMIVVNNRLQLQKQNNVYRGMGHAFASIVRHEGVTELYRGFCTTLPQLSAAFLYNAVYERSRHLFKNHLKIDDAPTVSALAGGIASPSAQLIYVPFDIIAQHMMFHKQHAKFSGGKGNTSIADALAHDGLEGKRPLPWRVAVAVYSVDGMGGFYRGYFSTVSLYLPFNMIMWSTYYHALAAIEKTRKWAEPAVEVDSHRHLLFDQAVAGSIGGIVGAIATNPLEMIRIRTQMHRTSYKETIRRLIKHEGRRVFYQGLAPRVVSSALFSTLLMFGYETAKRFSVLPEYRDSIQW